jgi:hypothetical protein
MADELNLQGDWWVANAPSMRSGMDQFGQPQVIPSGTYPMYPGTPQTSGGGDPQALIAQWQAQHSAENPDIPGLVQFLNQNGIGATQATHAGGQLSDDKIIINGGMYDLGSSLGAAGGSWFSNPQPDMNDPNAGGSASNSLTTLGGFAPGTGGPPGSMSNLYTPSDLTAGWTQPFAAPTMDQFMNSPGIQAGLQLGQQALERSAASKGTLLTGGTLKDLSAFANDYASQKYGDVYGRAFGEYQDAKNTFFQNQGNLFNRNFSLAQLGENAATQSGLQGQNYANAAGNLYGDLGNAQSAGTIGSANAWMPTLGAGANALTDYLSRTRSSY